MQTIDFTVLKNEVLAFLDTSDEYLRTAFKATSTISFKKGTQLSTSIVTEADSYIENLLFEKLSTRFPDIGYLGEERVQKLQSEYNWIVDPIDGTGNFAVGIPLFGTSIALWHKNKPVATFISFPALTEVIWSIKGEGVYLNGEKQTPSNLAFPKPSALYSHVGTGEEKLATLHKIVDEIDLPKYYGCTVYSGAAVALGKANCLVCINNAIWDLAGIMLINQEMGRSTQFLSDQPDISHTESLKKYNLSAVFGDETLVTSVVKKLKETDA